MAVINKDLLRALSDNPIVYFSSAELVETRIDPANNNLDLDNWRLHYSRALNAEHVLGRMLNYFKGDNTLTMREWQTLSLDNESLAVNGGAAGMMSLLFGIVAYTNDDFTFGFDQSRITRDALNYKFEEDVLNAMREVFNQVAVGDAKNNTVYLSGFELAQTVPTRTEAVAPSRSERTSVVLRPVAAPVAAAPAAAPASATMSLERTPLPIEKPATDTALSDSSPSEPLPPATPAPAPARQARVAARTDSARRSVPAPTAARTTQSTPASTPVSAIVAAPMSGNTSSLQERIAAARVLNDQTATPVVTTVAPRSQAQIRASAVLATPPTRYTAPAAASSDAYVASSTSRSSSSAGSNLPIRISIEETYTQPDDTVIPATLPQSENHLTKAAVATVIGDLNVQAKELYKLDDDGEGILDSLESALRPADNDDSMEPTIEIDAEQVRNIRTSVTRLKLYKEDLTKDNTLGRLKRIQNPTLTERWILALVESFIQRIDSYQARLKVIQEQIN